MRGLLAAFITLLASAAAAQDFPNRAVRIVVGFPAGGPSDVPARIISEKLRVALGQPVIVENKTGAAGMIALNDVLAQPRDGHAEMFGDLGEDRVGEQAIFLGVGIAN